MSDELDLLDRVSECSSVRLEWIGTLSISSLVSLDTVLLLIVGVSTSVVVNIPGEPTGLVFTTSCLDTSVKIWTYKQSCRVLAK